jgi:hypothetical protein
VWAVAEGFGHDCCEAAGVAEECVADVGEETLAFWGKLECRAETIEAWSSYAVEIAHGLVVGVV